METISEAKSLTTTTTPTAKQQQQQQSLSLSEGCAPDHHDDHDDHDGEEEEEENNKENQKSLLRRSTRKRRHDTNTTTTTTTNTTGSSNGSVVVKRSRAYSTTSEDEGHLLRAADIQSRMRLLFPDEEDNVVHKPCMSARLFACFSIVAEEGEEEEEEGEQPLLPKKKKKKKNGGTVTRRDTSSRLPIVSLLRSLVHAECVALGHSVERGRVQFSGFDGSSTQPPRDSVLGSDQARASSIDATVAALNEAHKLVQQQQQQQGNDGNDEDDNDETRQCVQCLCRFLDRIQSSTMNNKHQHDGHYNPAKMRKQCAKSMPFSWNEKRFQRVARMYKADFDTILQCLVKRQSLAESTKHLNLEYQLATSLGRAIRYHLRRFFNPCYGEVTFADDVDDATKQCVSKVSDLVEMSNPEWYNTGNDTAVADGSISSVFSQAVEAVAYYFSNDFSKESFRIPDMPQRFCVSSACQRGLGTRRQPVTISEEDLESIVNDMLEAQRFLACAKACRFLVELLHWPGVDDEILHLGGWGVVEGYAALFEKHRLGRLSPLDAHLVLLSDMGRFEERIAKCWDVMESVAEECTAALDELWSRFECGTKSRKRREEYPAIEVLEMTLAEGLKLHMFPTLVDPNNNNTEVAWS